MAADRDQSYFYTVGSKKAASVGSAGGSSCDSHRFFISVPFPVYWAQKQRGNGRIVVIIFMTAESLHAHFQSNLFAKKEEKHTINANNVHS